MTESETDPQLHKTCRDTYTVLAQYVSEMGLRGLTAEPCVAKALVEQNVLPEENAKWLAGEVVRIHNELLGRIRTAARGIAPASLASAAVATPGDDPLLHCRG